MLTRTSLFLFTTVQKSYVMPQRPIAKYTMPMQTVHPYGSNPILQQSCSALCQQPTPIDSYPPWPAPHNPLPVNALPHSLQPMQLCLYEGYLTFPSSLLLMMTLQTIVFVRWILHKKHYKYIVERVYLYESGVVQFYFANKISKMLNSRQDSHFFEQASQLMTPPCDDKQYYPTRGYTFPQSFDPSKPISSIRDNLYYPMGYPYLYYSWAKYTESYENYNFPAKFQYMNWQLMTALFNGYSIATIDCLDEQDPDAEEYFSTEKEIAIVKKNWDTHPYGVVQFASKIISSSQKKYQQRVEDVQQIARKDLEDYQVNKDQIDKENQEGNQEIKKLIRQTYFETQVKHQNNERSKQQIQNKK